MPTRVHPPRTACPQDAHRQRTVNWINAAGGLATAFDITLKGIMHAGGCSAGCRGRRLKARLGWGRQHARVARSAGPGRRRRLQACPAAALMLLPLPSPPLLLLTLPPLPLPPPTPPVFERCEYWRLKDGAGKPAGLLGWWPSRSVTFLENHDTVGGRGRVTGGAGASACLQGRLQQPAQAAEPARCAACRVCWSLADSPPRSAAASPLCRPAHPPARTLVCVPRLAQGSSQGHWRFPHHAVEQGYAYILTHPGTPCVFWDHLSDRSACDMIARLIAIRKRAGIHCRSPVRARGGRAWAAAGPWLAGPAWPVAEGRPAAARCLPPRSPMHPPPSAPCTHPHPLRSRLWPRSATCTPLRLRACAAGCS